ncbi:hypothetical protein Pmani_028310 [Petrolisthes manimaculis]|uniref:Uncharacterized protein n=1 Tax=Petrolisthes manimaculis TaxID=1843537 RepID=A0AAE1P0D0_9EUCA|nr:hypothetical protein Pmani_028310 [Petrolisthes manimaculis]
MSPATRVSLLDPYLAFPLHISLLDPYPASPLPVSLLDPYPGSTFHFSLIHLYPCLSLSCLPPRPSPPAFPLFMCPFSIPTLLLIPDLVSVLP